MLTKLRVKNFLLFNELEIDFNRGFTVVTGETGSGKSIIIEALQIVFGDKVAANVIRMGAQQAVFEVEFDLNNTKAQQYLHEIAMLDDDDNSSLLCRRVIHTSGKSKNYINGNLATVQQMRQLGELILDVYTQHASITILKHETQRMLLDEFAQIDGEVKQLEKLYRAISDIERDIANFEAHYQQMQQDIAELNTEYSDLSSLNLAQNEWQELNLEHKGLSNAQFILDGLTQITNMADNDYENAASIKSISKKMLQIVESIHNTYPKCDNLISLLNSILVEVGEVEHEANQLINSFDINEQRLSDIEIRISAIFDMARKYRILPQEVCARLEDISSKLSSMNQSSNIDELRQQRQELMNQYKKIALTIGNQRKTSGIILSKKVNELLIKLGINGLFNVDVSTHDKMTSYGFDIIEYQVSFNKGLQMQPLAKVASGGELSRVALALYLQLSKNNPPEVIIFDEIDVGIGGKIAAYVGEMLKDLGKDKQVISITHQPQTASYGDNHLSVRKQVKKDMTTVEVKELQQKERITEIARMLSGVAVTDVTIKHATELLEH